MWIAMDLSSLWMWIARYLGSVDSQCGQPRTSDLWKAKYLDSLWIANVNSQVSGLFVDS